MPAANAVIKGNLTAKDFDALKGISSATDNTLQSLFIAQSMDGLWTEEPPNIDNTEEKEAQGFDIATDKYWVRVPFSGYPLVVNAVPTSSEAKVDIFCPAVDGEYEGGTYDVTITVTPQILVLHPDQADADESITTKTYTITVTRGAAKGDAMLSAVSLVESSQISSPTVADAKMSFLVHKEVETVHISAVTTDQNAVVKISGDSPPANYTDAANKASAAIDLPSGDNDQKTIYMTVWAENRLTKANSTVIISKDQDSTPSNAKGGNLLIMKVDGTDYEIHTFLVDDITESGGQKDHTLTFTDQNKRPSTVEVLVVAGGGGGGNSGGSHCAGGGGAGGYIYVPEYDITGYSDIAVKVGAGGHPPPPAVFKVADNGGNSAFGGIMAYGGGGGASHKSSTAFPGRSGGSGGGASFSNSGGAKIYGTVFPENTDAVYLGNAGGSGNGSGNGGGGGGAGDVGFSPPANVPYQGAMGGAGTQSEISGTLKWYAGGGAGGADAMTPPDGAESNLEAYGATAGNNGDPNTGDGGSGAGGLSGRLSGGKGGSGIVIVRWPYME